MFASTEGGTAVHDGYREPAEGMHEQHADAADAVTELYAREELSRRKERTEAAIRRAETAR